MKQVSILGGLLALSLVGSYLTWTAPSDDGRDTTDVVVIRTTPDALKALTWEEEGKTIRVERATDPRGDYLWFHTQEDNPIQEKLTQEDALDGVTPEDVAPSEPRSMTFAGNEQAHDIWEAFAPLYGMRELALEPGADLAPYGLDDPKTTLTVDVDGRSTVLALGGEAFGTRDRYVKADGKVFLIDDKTMRPLQFASTRLVERRLFPLAETDMRQVMVARDGDVRTLVQGNADDRAASYWADADDPSAKDVEAGTWLGKLFRMRVRSYTTPDEVEGVLTPVFTFEVRGADGVWPVEVLQGTGDKGIEYYARPAFNRSLVVLTRTLAEEAIADLDTLFDGVTPEDAADAEDEAPAE